ncbi:MAG TPA: hypothetical protein VGD66_07635 [Allosphingosinicella sp.]|jgi:hypothetical protein
MFLKTFGALAPVMAGLLYFGGAFGGGFSRDVDRPPAAVLAALEALDITRQPGSPGTDPSRSGGVAAVFQLARGPDRITWTVMSGDKVATRMTAIVSPLDGGRRSRVTAAVERGDAPDDLVSPAFRSKGITLALFGAAIDDDLNALTAPPPGDPAKCDALKAKFEADNEAAGFAERPSGLGQAIGRTAQIAARLRAMEAELRRNGCDTSPAGGGGDRFTEVRSEMGNPGAEPAEGVSFKPGQPMVDTSRH